MRTDVITRLAHQCVGETANPQRFTVENECARQILYTCIDETAIMQRPAAWL